MQIGICYSYRETPESVVKHAKFLGPEADGLLIFAPLIDGATIDPNLLPVHPMQAGMNALDTDIHIIQQLVLDERLPSILRLPSTVEFRAVLVVNESWFRQRRVLYRSGMTEVFRISKKFAEASVGSAVFIGHQEFPLSRKRDLVFELPLRRALNVSALAQANDASETLANLMKFRHVLADLFSSALRKNAGKSLTIGFEVRVSTEDMCGLFDWPGFPTSSAQLSDGKTSHRVSYIVKEEAVHTPMVVKDVINVSIADPTILESFLGKRFINTIFLCFS